MPDYYAFLLRLWQAGSPENPAWRATLENPHTHQRLGFDTLEALCAYLQEKHFTPPDPQTQPEPSNLHPDNQEHNHENP